MGCKEKVTPVATEADLHLRKSYTQIILALNMAHSVWIHSTEEGCKSPPIPARIFCTLLQISLLTRSPRHYYRERSSLTVSPAGGEVRLRVISMQLSIYFLGSYLASETSRILSVYWPSCTLRLRFREVPLHPYSCCPSYTSIVLLSRYVISFLCVILCFHTVCIYNIICGPCFNTCTG
ncbi:hypothetical protein EDC04DRAFT_1451001 [Pisolithus marmoratus]|nr:hypothetical protein EDC04DRAFT_1451001 [Pisolithus marmoratus]